MEGCAVCFGLPLVLTFKSNYTPSCSINDLYIPTLDTRLPIFSATFIFFDLHLDNNIGSDGVHYEFINLTLAFYYAWNMIANYTVPRFSQGDDKTAHLRDLVVTAGYLGPMRFLAAFTVEFSATVKVDRDVGHSRDKQLLLRADMEVNDLGKKVQNKDIELLPFVTLISLQSDELINVHSVQI